VSMHIHMLFSFFPSNSAIDNSSFDCEGMAKSQTERGEGQEGFSASVNGNFRYFSLLGGFSHGCLCVYRLHRDIVFSNKQFVICFCRHGSKLMQRSARPHMK
jgi:hypothetical protein